MAHAEVGGARQLAYREALPKLLLQSFNNGPNARGYTRGAFRLLAFRVTNSMEQAKRQRASQCFKIKCALQAALFGLGNQEPA